MRSYFVCVFAVTIWCVSAGKIVGNQEDARQLYEEFKQKYGKNHANEEDERRFAIFGANLMRAQLLQEMDQGTAEYGVTQFSDLTVDEFRSKYLGMRPVGPLPIHDPQVPETLPSDDDDFDWRQHGAVGPVQDQGACGSCWAFSVVGNVEGQWFRKTKKLLKLSEQQLVDCDKADDGCDGGLPPETYKQIRLMGGLELFRDYPYEARDNVCRMQSSKLRVYVNDSKILPLQEKVQAEQLKEMGPLSSALNANVLQSYKRGIIQLPAEHCDPNGLNHAVLSVGYGTEHGKPYWIVRNSWGRGFGEKGYFRIYRGGGTCGINRMVTTAIIK